MRRIRLLEVTAHYLVDGREVTQISEEDVELDDILQRTASGFGHGLEVLENLHGLGFEALDQFHCLGIQRNLAGQVNGIAGLDRLGVGADGSGGLVGVDDGLAHGNSSAELAIGRSA